MNHFRFLVLRSAFLLALSACAVFAERVRATDYDAYLEDIAYAIGIQPQWDFPLANNIHDSVASIMYDNRDFAAALQLYLTNNVKALPEDDINPRHARLSGFRADLQRLVRVLGGDSDYYLSNGEDHESTWRVWDYEWQNEDYELTSFREFMSLALGQNFDARPGWEMDVEGYDAFTNVWEHAFTGEGADWTVGPGLSTAQFWNGWQAEAWRRLLRAVTTSTNTWDTPEGTNQWDAILADSTNGVPRVPVSSTNLWAASLSFVSNSVPTNAIAWGQYGTTNASPDMPQPLVRDIGWQWVPPEGGAYEVKLFGFEQVDPGLTGSLSIDFQDPMFGVVNKAAKFFWALGTAVFMFMLLRNEWNFWTTLGGSAT